MCGAWRLRGSLERGVSRAQVAPSGALAVAAALAEKVASLHPPPRGLGSTWPAWGRCDGEY